MKIIVPHGWCEQEEPTGPKNVKTWEIITRPMTIQDNNCVLTSFHALPHSLHVGDEYIDHHPEEGVLVHISVLLAVSGDFVHSAVYINLPSRNEGSRRE